MEEKELNGKESLELISRMIQQTRQNMDSGRGNSFLLYGYATLGISLVTYFLILITHNNLWWFLWLLMLVLFLVDKWRNRNKHPNVVTYIDRMITSTWKVTGTLTLLTLAAIPIIGFFVFKKIHFELMMPFSLICIGIGVSITGMVLKMKTLIYTPFIAFVIAIYMIQALLMQQHISNEWNLLEGFSFLVMLVIPGHFLNKKH